jgi:hypothetical protein
VVVGGVHRGSALSEEGRRDWGHRVQKMAERVMTLFVGQGTGRGGGWPKKRSAMKEAFNAFNVVGFTKRNGGAAPVTGGEEVGSGST